MLHRQLTQQGILACYPYSILSIPRAKELNGILVRTLSHVFPSLRVFSAFRPLNNDKNSRESNECYPLKEIMIASKSTGLDKLDSVQLVARFEELNPATDYFNAQYIEALFALSDISGEITYDTIDFSQIHPATINKQLYPYKNYEWSYSTDDPIKFIEFGVSKFTGEIEARIHLLNKEVLIRR